MRGIQTQFAEYERAKITERTRRGKVAKAHKGQIFRSSKPPFGFRYTATGDALLIRKPEMAVVEKIFRMAAAGLGRHAIQTRLYAEGVPSPKGERVWSRSTLKKILFSDLYITYMRDELAGLVPAEVLDRVDAHARFGIWWFGRKQVTVTGYSPSHPENGGRLYKEHTTTRIRPKEERTAVPVPAYLPRCLVDQARDSLAANKSTERKYLAREWELRGILRCVCGSIMATQTARSGAGNSTYHYYRCGRRRKLGSMCDCTQKSITATDIEEIVWSFVSRLMQDPEAIRRGMKHLIEREQIAQTDNPEREAQTWLQKIDECDRRRSAYQDQQAAGLMTLQELGAKLNELENIRKTAEQELVALKTHQRRMDELEKDYVALLESMAQIVPEALNSPQERNATGFTGCCA